MLDRNALKILHGDEEPLEPSQVVGSKPVYTPDRWRGRAGWVLAGIAVLVAIVGGLFWWMSSAKQVLVETVRVETDAIGGGRSSSMVLNASGYVVARRIATVSSNVTGKIAEIFVDEGATVRKGQALARLDDATARAGVALSESRVQLAKASLAEVEARIPESRRNLERLRKLANEGIISESSFDQAQSAADALEAKPGIAKKEVEVAQRQLDLNQQALTDLVIRAPFSGVVVSKSAQPGEIISPASAGDGYTRTGISTIVDMQSLEIEVDVNESYVDRVRPGQRTEAVLEAYPGWRIPGHVINIVPTANRQKSTVRVRVGFESPDPRMLPNMGVQVAFLEDANQTNSVPPSAEVKKRFLIPEAAMKEESGSKYVFVVEDGHARRRAVDVGQAKGGRVEIVSGLNGGEWIVTSHEGVLADSAVVKVKRSSTQ